MKKALIVVMSLSACLSFGQVLPEHIPGEVLVKFKPGTQLVAMLENNRLEARVAENIPNINVSRIILPDGMSVEDAIKHYASLPYVEFAEANLIMRTAYTPNLRIRMELFMGQFQRPHLNCRHRHQHEPSRLNIESRCRLQFCKR